MLQDLERGLTVMTRNHTQELKTLLHKNKALTQEVEALKDASQRILAQLKVSPLSQIDDFPIEIVYTGSKLYWS